MRDKDTRILSEIWELGAAALAAKKAWDWSGTWAWDKHYMGHDLDAIQELVDFLKDNYVEGRQYRIHTARGDDLPNTIEIHKDLGVDPETLERGYSNTLTDLLDAASGPPEGEGEDSDDWFDHEEEEEKKSARHMSDSEIERQREFNKKHYGDPAGFRGEDKHLLKPGE